MRLDDDLSAAWQDLSAEAQDVALHGSGEQSFSVTWSYKRGKRAGIHSFEGPWLGLCGLVEREAKRRARRKDAVAWTEPLEDTPCTTCDGSGLQPEVAAVEVGGLRLPDVMQLRADAVLSRLDAAQQADTTVYNALRPELAARIEALCALGLGHLALSRRSPTLSTGELQRLRLANVLQSGLAHTTLVLDEPTAGLHEDDVLSLLERLRALRDAGNTIVVVSHRPALLRGADHLVELGPGSGPEGGRIVAQGTPAEVLAGESPTALALRQAPEPRAARERPVGVRIRGVHAHGLPGLDFTLPESGLVAITGPSGSGKSTLLFDVLEASARAKAPRGCTAAEGLERFADLRSSRGHVGQTPLTILGVLPALQRLFADASDGALPKAAFSFDSPKGRCEVCKGRGYERVSMDALADIALTCPACDGRRYRPEVLAVRWQGRSIADVLDCPATLLTELFEGPLQRAAIALVDVGLGHLALGRDRSTLSGGEAQRLMLASRLLDTTSPALVLLDEPGTGLHESDLHRLRSVFDRMTQRGDLVVIAEHRASLISACDQVVEMAPPTQT